VGCHWEEEADRSVAALVEWEERHHRNSLTWKVWKTMVEFVAPARDHDRAKMKDQAEGEGFPDAVYRCWRNGVRD